jgi:hypothetical protein
MNTSRSKLFIFLLFVATFLINSCSKDSDEAAREALIYKITGDIKADSIQAYVSWMQAMGTRFALANSHRNVAVSITTQKLILSRFPKYIRELPITRHNIMLSPLSKAILPLIQYA